MILSESIRFRSLHLSEVRFPTGRLDHPHVCEYVGTPGKLNGLLAEHATSILELLSHKGALLFRNTGLDMPLHLKEFSEALQLRVASYPYFTDNHRATIGSGIVNASSVSPSLPVPPHTEQAFARVRPGIVCFMSLLPAASGGETPLHDCVGAYNELTLQTQNLLSGTRFGKRTNQLSVQGLLANFNTDDRHEIEQICARFGIIPRWADGQLSFSTSGPCLVRHPTTLDTSLSLFWTAPSIYFFFRRYHNTLEANSLLVHLCRLMPASLFEAMARCFYFRGDYDYFFTKNGVPLRLPVSILREIDNAVANHTTVFRWRKGDILVIDNVRSGHSRMPYKPPRQTVSLVANYYDSLHESYAVPQEN